MLKDLWAVREAVREKNPLVYNITNTVVTNFTANVLLAAGASPIMSEGAAEAEDLARICSVLVLNIGTLHTRQVGYCLKAGEYANKFQKPVVLDPVGVGATAYRNITAGQILQDVRLALIRGNYGEIGFIAGTAGQVKGVDSADSGLDLTAVKKMAQEYSTLVAATGATDYLTDGQAVMTNTTGHELLQLVTGTGCALTSLTGAFLAVADEPQLGVLAALAFYGAAAQKAAENSKGPGSFMPKFLDALYNLSYKEFKKAAEDRVTLLTEAAAVPAPLKPSTVEGEL